MGCGTSAHVTPSPPKLTDESDKKGGKLEPPSPTSPKSDNLHKESDPNEWVFDANGKLVHRSKLDKKTTTMRKISNDDAHNRSENYIVVGGNRAELDTGRSTARTSALDEPNFSDRGAYSPMSFSSQPNDRALSPTSLQEVDFDATQRQPTPVGFASVNVNDAFDDDELDLLAEINTDTAQDVESREQRKQNFALKTAKLVGKKTFNWKRGRLLGMGGFGKVYLATNLDTEEKMAVKMIEIGGMGMREGQLQTQIQKVENEIAVLKTLSHTNIVQYFGVDRIDDSAEDAIPGLCIFMEYVEGGSLLAAITNSRPLTEPVACAYTYQILVGLEYLHRRNIAHRDIKPANVLITRKPYMLCQNTLKIADFGASRMLNDLVSCSEGGAQTLTGTPHFMAPEVILQTGHSVKADIWSLGGSVIEMMTGKPPWWDQAPMAVLFKIGTNAGPPPLPEHLSDAGRDFLIQCFTRDFHERPGAAELLNHEWFAPLHVMDAPANTSTTADGASRPKLDRKLSSQLSPFSAASAAASMKHRAFRPLDIDNEYVFDQPSEEQATDWDRPIRPTSKAVRDYFNKMIREDKSKKDGNHVEMDDNIREAMEAFLMVAREKTERDDVDDWHDGTGVGPATTDA